MPDNKLVKFPPPPPPKQVPPTLPGAAPRQAGIRAGKGARSVLPLVIFLVLFALLLVAGGSLLANRHEESVSADLTLADRIIGSWTLYMDNTGVGAYVHLNADGSMQLTEGRIGEWMTAEHRLVEDDSGSFLEFFCEDTNRWIRFMAIEATADGKQLLLTYLQQ